MMCVGVRTGVLGSLCFVGVVLCVVFWCVVVVGDVLGEVGYEVVVLIVEGLLFIRCKHKLM